MYSIGNLKNYPIFLVKKLPFFYIYVFPSLKAIHYCKQRRSAYIQAEQGPYVPASGRRY